MWSFKHSLIKLPKEQLKKNRKLLEAYSEGFKSTTRGILETRNQLSAEKKQKFEELLKKAFS